MKIEKKKLNNVNSKKIYNKQKFEIRVESFENYFHNLLVSQYYLTNEKIIISKQRNITDKNKIKYIYLLLFLFFIQIIISNERITKMRNIQLISEITINIKGKGDQYILNNKTASFENRNYSFNYLPDKILINGINLQYKDFMVYNLEKEENNITMVFDNLLTECNVMFFNLSNITKIDFSKFDSSKVTGMACMFQGCNSLESINFNNFNTASLKTMHRMFGDCIKLTSMDLSSFDTSLVTSMYGTFSSCISLVSLDLVSFNTISVEEMAVMFFNCSSLIELNLKNFDTSSVINFHGIFKYCYSLLSIDISNFDTSSANNMNDMFYGCHSLISLNISHFNTSSALKSIYRMFLDTNNKTIYCLDLDNTPRIIELLESVNKDYINDCMNICFTNKNKKIIKEKNICIQDCFNDDTFKLEYKNICYKSCPNNTHVSFDNHTCIIDNFLVETDILTNQISVPKENGGLINDIIPNWDINEFFNGTYQINYINSTIKDKIANNIKNDILNGNINLTNLVKGEQKDLIFSDNTTLFQITTTNNQKNEEYDDISTIQLGECETILKDIYKIDKNLPLIIFKIEHYVPGVLIPVIGYDIFDPINKTKLDLNYCKEAIVNFQIPVSLDDDDLFKYDPTSEYYTDECYTYTTDNGTDIILNDRQEEYNNENYSLCENNCSFVEYNKDTKKAVCECGIKSKEYVISEIIDSENLLSTYNFTNNSSSSNMVAMKCVYTVFSKEGLSTNIGNYILILITITFVILSIFFYKVGYELLLNEIKLIIRNEEEKRGSDNEVNIYNNHHIRKDKKRKSNVKRKSKKLSIVNTKNVNTRKSYSIINLKNDNHSKLNNIKVYEKKKNNENKFETLYDYEINNFSYKNALKYDNRTFFQYYMSLIKTKHPIIFSFFPIKDYNSAIIKASLFLLLFSIIYIINALFFNESTIHKIYEEEGIYNFIYFIPKIFISFVISHIIYTIIKYFCLSEKNLVDIKNFYNDNDKITKNKKSLVIKYISYFVVGIILLIFFWYYLSSFCAVFKNSQVYLIKNTLISLLISLIYPFFINFLPPIFRIIALNGKKKECIYKLSKYIQII